MSTVTAHVAPAPRPWWRSGPASPAIFANETFMTRMTRLSAASPEDTWDSETIKYIAERFDAADKRGAAGC